MAREFSLFRMRKEFDNAAERTYAAHLKRVRRNLPRDLWRYFAEEFFHDGTIKTASFDLLRRRLDLIVDAPNIKQRKGDRSVYVLDAPEYRCSFEGVDHLQVSARYKSKPVDFGRKWDWTYLSGELETLSGSPAAARKDKQRSHSLIIEALEGWIEITFLRLRVLAVDQPRVRAMQKARGEFYFPFPGNVLPKWAHWERMLTSEEITAMQS